MSSTILGSGKKLEDFMLKTEVFDTPGNFTFNHPNPGNALDVEVLIVGAGGGAGGLTFSANSGNVNDGTDGADGGNTIWDVGGSPVTANGGKGGKYYPFAGSTTGFSGDGYIKGHGPGSGVAAVNTATIPGIPYGFGGYSGYCEGLAAGSTGHSGGGGTGYFKKFNATITNNVNITIGQAGINGDSDSNANLNALYEAPRSAGHGAIIVSYAKASAGIPAPIAKEFVEEWIDKDRETADGGVWQHPNPGQAITMTVICIGGGGGNTYAGQTNGGNGGSTSFDSVTALGGNGAIGGGSPACGAAVSGGLPGNYSQGSTGHSLVPNILPSFGTFGAVEPKHPDNAETGYTAETWGGATGGIKIGRITVTGNVNYTIGAGGTEGSSNFGNGLPGGIILKYSK
jgi:hypothetical protein